MTASVAAVAGAGLRRRVGLTEVERVVFPSDGDRPLAASKRILVSLDRALAVARGLGAEEIVRALCWNDIRGIELVPRPAERLAAPVRLLPYRKVRQLIGESGVLG